MQHDDAGDTVDWGYLKAGDQQYGDGVKQYDLLGDEVLNLPLPPPPVMPALVPSRHQSPLPAGELSSVSTGPYLRGSYIFAPHLPFFLHGP